jgi:hypothetical protein
MRCTYSALVCIITLLVLAVSIPVSGRRHHSHSDSTPLPLAVDQSQEHIIQLANKQYEHLHAQLDAAFDGIRSTNLQDGSCTYCTHQCSQCGRQFSDSFGLT